MQQLISKEFRKFDEYFDNFEVVKKLNEEYAIKMKKNFENSQNSFRNGQKDEAKKYSEIGKSYKILVDLSTSNLKEMKKQNSRRK